MNEQKKCDVLEAKWLMKNGRMIGRTAEQVRKILDAWLDSGKTRLSIAVIEADLLAERQQHRAILEAKDAKIRELEEKLRGALETLEDISISSGGAVCRNEARAALSKIENILNGGK